ncbi:MAG: YbaB/EbfC family nucleoid-associated protein [Candidatus Gracilibacteria bacterium]|nr:YbaB/EbfC family nucleoid-associated protein [Candidatus Gracilibacteria bacterium]
MDYSKMGELMKMQQEMAKIQKELENTLVESEVDGLVITFNGKMEVEKVEFEDTSIIGNKEALEKAILEATNKGLKESQRIAGERMQGVMQGMGIDPNALPPM